MVELWPCPAPGSDWAAYLLSWPLTLTPRAHCIYTLYLHTVSTQYIYSIYSIYCATPGRRTRAAAHQQHWDQLETIIQINLNPSHHQQRHYLYQHSQLNCQHLYHLLGYLECLMMKVKPVGMLNHVWKLKELSRICWWYKLNVMKYCEPSPLCAMCPVPTLVMDYQFTNTAIVWTRQPADRVFRGKC